MDSKRRAKKLKLLRILHTEYGYSSGLTRQNKLLRDQLRESIVMAEAASYGHYWREHTHATHSIPVIIHPPVTSDPWL